MTPVHAESPARLLVTDFESDFHPHRTIGFQHVERGGSSESLDSRGSLFVVGEPQRLAAHHRGPGP